MVNGTHSHVHAKVQVDHTHQATSPPGWIIVIINRNEA